MYLTILRILAFQYLFYKTIRSSFNCRTSPEELLERLEKSELDKQKKQRELDLQKECSKTPSASSKLQTDTLLQSKPKVNSAVCTLSRVLSLPFSGFVECNENRACRGKNC
jgi:hypothetical protein